jgi:hypothetical protein
LINWIGRQTEAVVLAVNEECRLAVAILLILWVSALASAFVDNIPLTTMMIRIVTNLNQELDLPLQPLVWALAFGACLGGELEILIEASAESQFVISGDKCEIFAQYSISLSTAIFAVLLFSMETKRKTNLTSASFEVFTAVTKRSPTFWYAALCSLGEAELVPECMAS